MKLVHQIKATYINHKIEEYEKNDKTKGFKYSVSLEQDGECGTLKTVESVVRFLEEDFIRFDEVYFITEYNDKYDTYKVIGVKHITFDDVE